MFDPEFSIQDTFPKASYDEWHALAEAALKGVPFEKKLVKRTYEGLELQPVYCSQDQLGEGNVSGTPGQPPFVRGVDASGAVAVGWDLRQEHSSSDLSAANEAIIADQQGGASSVLLVLDAAAQTGLDPDHGDASQLVGQGGVAAYQVDDLDTVLSGVELSTCAIALEAGAAFLPAAAQLIALWQRRQLATSEIRGAFNADPLGVFAKNGFLPNSVEASLSQLIDLTLWTAEHIPQVTAVGVNTAPYHHAGATASQDLAFAMATGLEYLRQLTAAGMHIDAAARQILFRMSIGTEHFKSIAKLRAGRRLWSRIVSVCEGAPESGGMRVHARLSDRVLTKYDPYVNLLRNTVSVFAAGVGGAEAITSLPFDQLSESSNEFSRRVARNTGLILQEESHLHRVIDPAGGSWYLEQLTNQLAEKAWSIFQNIERQGGMSRALADGWVARQVEIAHAARAKDIATRRQGITGVSEFPDLDQTTTTHQLPDLNDLHMAASQRIVSQRQDIASLSSITSANSKTKAAVVAASAGATIGQLACAVGLNGNATSIGHLPSRRLAAPYEDLRDASEHWLANSGRRPCVFLANFGPVAQYTARVTYSKNFFEVGGFEVIDRELSFSDGGTSATQAFAESGAAIAVLCSADHYYSDFVPQTAQAFKQAGARTILLAGRPGANEEAWRAAGVDRFIYISCDVLGTLRELLVDEGVVEA